MKPATFDYLRATSIAEAAALAGDGARPLAGGQSLGPMMNLRLARPGVVIDIRTLAELQGAKEDAAAVTWGAATTHAMVEDGVVPDPTGCFLRGVARGIAYRAVRNRGTVGGSLCHADPAADWPVALLLVGAEIELFGAAGPRRLPLQRFLRGPFETALNPGEILRRVHIPRPPPGTRHARHKLVRKTGEFAQAMAAVRHGPGGTRVVLGAIDAAPLLLDSVAAARDAIPGLDLPAHRRAGLLACLDRAAQEVGP